MPDSCRPNRAHGLTSDLMVQEEVCWGELAHLGDPAVPQDAYAIEPTSETLGNPVNTIESERVTGTRARAGTERGNNRPGGDLNKELQPNGPDPLFFKHFLAGEVATEAAGSLFKHTISGGMHTPEGLSIQKRKHFRDNSMRRQNFLGCVVNQIGLTKPNEGIVTVRYGILARRWANAAEDMDANPVMPVNNDPFNGFHVQALVQTYGADPESLAAPVVTMELNGNNNFGTDEFLLDGSRDRADLPEGERIINGNMTLQCTKASYDDLIAGPFVDDDPLRLDITMTRGDYIFRILVPRFKLRGDPPPKIPGKQPIGIELQWEAEEDPEEGTDIIVEITNDDPEISTASGT